MDIFRACMSGFIAYGYALVPNVGVVREAPSSGAPNAPDADARRSEDSISRFDPDRPDKAAL